MRPRASSGSLCCPSVLQRSPSSSAAPRRREQLWRLQQLQRRQSRLCPASAPAASSPLSASGSRSRHSREEPRVQQRPGPRKRSEGELRGSSTRRPTRSTPMRTSKLIPRGTSTPTPRAPLKLNTLQSTLKQRRRRSERRRKLSMSSATARPSARSFLRTQRNPRRTPSGRSRRQRVRRLAVAWT
ncbi:hypothetical protein L596_027747 [Steinernema carpocapsae]|uniref:Uncharacterized protein n=1 Tax=Steinernema carpocapsae TaxID=34508 RepID=A0A4U5LWE4_STECR|nr:hypothetical protein L596_027747 [Steinernema carpocapsae]